MKVLRKAFNQALDPLVTPFVSSVSDDQHLIAADITGSVAHVKMLEATGLLSADQSSKIQEGLAALLQLHEHGQFKLEVEYEDIHMNVEKKLEQVIGADAKLLHTARSRNDQVALDLRLFAVAQAHKIDSALKDLCLSLAEKALDNVDVVMPGYTHLQRAQPVLFSHVLHAYMEAFGRDLQRLMDAIKRTSISPLGAAALVGSGLPTMPEVSASALGFPQTFTNSIDAVSDRDFIAEIVFVCSLISIHLSQLAETIIIWCTKEFGFINLPDNLTTASSLMPQKKNPDPVELIRSKTGTNCGDLVNVLIVLKGLPIGYNRDLQDTKPPLISSTNTVIDALGVMALVVKNMHVGRDKTAQASCDPDLMATDLVDYLVLKNVPFRQAHDLVSELVTYARGHSRALSQLGLVEFQQFSERFDKDVFLVFDALVSVETKKSPGSTAPCLVKNAIKQSMVNLALANADQCPLTMNQAIPNATQAVPNANQVPLTANQASTNVTPANHSEV